jgi:hypothetical protein
MDNLGYLQLKAAPGLWQVRIRRGRSREVFKLDHVKGNTGDAGPLIEDYEAEIMLQSFDGVVIFPKVSKRQGMKGVDVLSVKKEKETWLTKVINWYPTVKFIHVGYGQRKALPKLLTYFQWRLDIYTNDSYPL